MAGDAGSPGEHGRCWFWSRLVIAQAVIVIWALFAHDRDVATDRY
jgi:hypothetical protein